MKKRFKNKNAGFIALFSGVIISIILLMIATNLSFTGFYKRYNVLDGEFKEKSAALAEACVNVAMLNLATSNSGPVEETIDGYTCTGSIAGGNTITIDADYKNYWTHLKIEVDPDNISIVSWQEI